MSNCIRIEKQLRISTHSTARLLKEAREYLGIRLDDLMPLKVFRVQWDDVKQAVSRSTLEEVFVDDILEKFIGQIRCSRT